MRIEPFKDHENRLSLTVIGDPGMEWPELRHRLDLFLDDLMRLSRPMNLDERNRLALLEYERSYLEVPE